MSGLNSFMRLMSALLVFAMIAGACGGDDSGDISTTSAGETQQPSADATVATEAAPTTEASEETGTTETSQAVEEEPAPEPVTLQFWTWFPSEETIQRVIDGFEAANPGITVEFNLFQNVAYQDRLPLALTSGDTIDVAAVQTSTMVNTVKADLAPLPPLFDQYASAPLESTLVPAAFQQARILADDGELYIAPLGFLGSAAAYYNADLLDELGLEVPRTRDDLRNMVQTVEAQRPDLLPISFTGANWFIDEIVLTVTEQIEPGFFNSVRYDAGGAWDSPTFAAAFEAVTSAFDEGIFSRTSSTSTTAAPSRSSRPAGR